MDKTIDLIKQAQARLKAMLSDFEAVALKAQEISAILRKHVEPGDNDGVSIKAIGPDLSVLSRREKEVFDLIGKGVKAKDIAKTLGISPKTCYGHREVIKEKLKLHSTFELQKLAEDLLQARKSDTEA